MKLPLQLIESLNGLQGFNRKVFEQVHSSGEQITSIRVNPLKNFKPKTLNLPDRQAGLELTQVPWSEFGFYLDKRPSFTFDPLFHAGCYYVQEASSMFLEQALKQTIDLSQPLRVLDLCAAPGGKSTHLQSLISKDSLLVSNEVIRSRANILKDNIIKWGCENVIVTSNDPKDFSKLKGFFDVLVVDAPCSGSGLFRRDPEAINEWTENNVQLCSQRQQRILADILPVLKDGGILIYSTCSYSKQEDEDITKWLQQEWGLQYLPLNIDPTWGIVETDKGYRFWPDKVKGEGFFISCFKKLGQESEYKQKQVKLNFLLTNKERTLLENWLIDSGKTLIKNAEDIYAWPADQFEDFLLIKDSCKMIYSGVLAGKLIRDKFIPDHALAMNYIISNNVRKIELSNEQAIRYLQKKDLEIDAGEKGWKLVTFNSFPLGWINVLPGRINNYYPKELRILKEF